MSLSDLWKVARNTYQTFFPPSYKDLLKAYRNLSDKATQWADIQDKSLTGEGLLDWLPECLIVISPSQGERIISDDNEINGILDGSNQVPILIKWIDPTAACETFVPGADVDPPEPQFWTIQKIREGDDPLYRLRRSIEDFDRSEFLRLREMLEESYNGGWSEAYSGTESPTPPTQ